MGANCFIFQSLLRAPNRRKTCIKSLSFRRLKEPWLCSRGARGCVLHSAGGCGECSACGLLWIHSRRSLSEWVGSRHCSAELSSDRLSLLPLSGIAREYQNSGLTPEKRHTQKRTNQNRTFRNQMYAADLRSGDGNKNEREGMIVSVCGGGVEISTLCITVHTLSVFYSTE